MWESFWFNVLDSDTIWKTNFLYTQHVVIWDKNQFIFCHHVTFQDEFIADDEYSAKPCWCSVTFQQMSFVVQMYITYGLMVRNLCIVLVWIQGIFYVWQGLLKWYCKRCKRMNREKWPTAFSCVCVCVLEGESHLILICVSFVRILCTNWSLGLILVPSWAVA